MSYTSEQKMFGELLTKKSVSSIPDRNIADYAGRLEEAVRQYSGKELKNDLVAVWNFLKKYHDISTDEAWVKCFADAEGILNQAEESEKEFVEVALFQTMCYLERIND